MVKKFAATGDKFGKRSKPSRRELRQEEAKQRQIPTTIAPRWQLSFEDGTRRADARNHGHGKKEAAGETADVRHVVDIQSGVKTCCPG